MTNKKKKNVVWQSNNSCLVIRKTVLYDKLIKFKFSKLFIDLNDLKMKDLCSKLYKNYIIANTNMVLFYQPPCEKVEASSP